MRRVGAILLAAGASTRLGEPKQLVHIGSENLLERSIRIAREAACSPIVVVLGASDEMIQQNTNLDGVKVVLNEGWQEGMGSSIRVGVEALQDVDGVVNGLLDGVVIMVCDMPAVTPSHLRALVESEGLMGTSYAGRRGVPAYFPLLSFSLLAELKGDAGARELLKAAPSIDLPGGELDIDTRNDLSIAQQRFGQ